ncbi:hypothetical protein GRI39_12105 [Altererythrobacter indicus]|uniref:DUF1648 domain-containing protein n=1 Tax=Altericroceibacterium indicum TaxID=374177 RepID=A0A845AI44_9SPHN|nr:hypothetical protein [Altericroceibacterium indicum]MXP26778.1 hypothetical protein [Altericroceibacterium indicum]
MITLILCILARIANTRFHDEARLPMQWWLTGDVTWSAPRPIALAFIPALAALTFSAMLIISQAAGLSPGQQHSELRAIIALGAVFVAVQLVHFWLIEKTLR